MLPEVVCMSILQSPLPKVARPLFLRLPSAWMSAPKSFLKMPEVEL